MWSANGQSSTNVSQPGPELHKSVDIIQFLHQTAGPQSDQICVIFRGSGKRIYDVNKMDYTNNVHV